MFTIKFLNQKRTETALVNMGKFATRPIKALKRIGVTMVMSTLKNFEAEGRPKWVPLSPMTLAMRRNKNKMSAKILRDTGNLMNSITYAIVDDDTGVQIGTNVKYAGTHQYGGKIKIPARTIVPKHAKVLSFMIGGKRVFATKVKQKARTVVIPQRKFLMFQEEDKDDIRQILVEELMGVVKDTKKQIGNEGSINQS